MASALVLSGVAAASGASASVSAASKTCTSLNTLNTNLQKALSSGDTGKVDTGAVSSLSKSFRKAAKTGPKSLRSAMNTIADVAASVASSGGSAVAAALALRKAGGKLTAAVVTWGTYLAKNCAGLTVPTT